MNTKLRDVRDLTLLALVLTSCELLNQNDFVETINIGSDDGEKIYCDVYQTGLDNYRYEFNMINEVSDTIKIFDAYLNDAVNGNEEFELTVKEDTIEITNSKPISNDPKEVNGKIYRLKVKE